MIDVVETREAGTEAGTMEEDEVDRIRSGDGGGEGDREGTASRDRFRLSIDFEPVKGRRMCEKGEGRSEEEGMVVFERGKGDWRK